MIFQKGFGGVTSTPQRPKNITWDKRPNSLNENDREQEEKGSDSLPSKEMI